MTVRLSVRKLEAFRSWQRRAARTATEVCRLGVPIAALLLTVIACRDEEQPGGGSASEVPRLEIRGSVMAPHRAVVVAPYDGRITAVAVSEGSIVRAGDFLVSLVNPSIDRDLAYARAHRALAEQQLKIRNAPTPAAAAAADPNRAARRRATAEIVKSRKQRLDRLRKLYETRDVSLQELEDAQAAYAAAQREALVYDPEPVKPPPAAAPVDNTDLLTLEVERARAEETVAATRKTLMNVTAPMAGVVTRVEAVEGSSVFARDLLLEISNTQTVDIRGQIAPELMRYVRVGQRAEVKVFTVPPRRFVEPIKNVIPPGSTGGPAVVVTIPNADGVLQVGTPVLISLRP